MPQRSTYYTEEEIAAIERKAERENESFSGVVRQCLWSELAVDQENTQV